jgi:anti-sigma factor RsiW
MTRCDLPDTDLIAYIDGELHGARREYVDIHLRVCPDCQARLEEIHETTRLLQRATPLTDDPDGRARIKARLAAEAQRPPRHSSRLPLLIALPALLLIIIGVTSITWAPNPTEAAVSLRALIRRADPNAGPPAPSTVLTRERLPGTAVLPPEQTNITHATIPTVV